ncbi:MAG: aminomethyltransferase family protein [Planctomycetota bacterium]
MPLPTPFHARTAPLCESYQWKDWSGFASVCRYETHHLMEYHAIRHSAGILDISPLQKYRVRGTDAASFLAWVMTRDVRTLAPSRVQYACFCDPDGHVIDDGTVAHLGPNDYRVTAASPTFQWLWRQSRGFDVEIEDETDRVAALAVQGPRARDVIYAATDDDALRRLRFFRVAETTLAGCRVQISRTGYTGDLGFEVWLDAGDAVNVWDAVVAAGSDYSARPVGLDALDMTRIEAGFVLQGFEYFSATRCIERLRSTPYEVGLGWTVDLERDPFIGQQALRSRQHQPASLLVGLVSDWEELERIYNDVELPPHLPDAAWRDAVPVYLGRQQVGQATSGCWSPLLKQNIALASIHPEYAALGTRLEIEHTVEYRRQRVTAVVSHRPFFDPPRKRGKEKRR